MTMNDNEYDLLNINFIQSVNYFSLLLQKVRSSFRVGVKYS